MKILADRNIPLVEPAFNGVGDVIPADTADITPEAVKDVDVLIVRSETRVGKALLAGSGVRFVATATIGTDHIDLAYLHEKKIGFASAPGSNANAVKEYVVAALLHCAGVLGWRLNGKTIGVVGVGNVGSKVVEAAEALGMRVLQNDPPLARSTGQSRFVPLDELLTADAITLHVPLTHAGTDATFHLFDQGTFERMKRGILFINTSRGPVVETAALKEAIRRGIVAHAIVDVWEGEPSIDRELLGLCTLATPHIAGYSLEGRVNAVRMVREAVCHYFGLRSSLFPFPSLPPAGLKDISPDPGHSEDHRALNELVKQLYDIKSDDEKMRLLATQPDQAGEEYFLSLRHQYPPRREFSTVTVHLPAARTDLARPLVALGFHCTTDDIPAAGRGGGR